MSQQTSSNPFGGEKIQKQEEKVEKSRPELPPLIQIPDSTPSTKPVKEEIKTNAFGDNPEKPKNNEPVSYFKYLNGNNPTSNIPTEHNSSNNSSNLKIHSFDEKVAVKKEEEPQLPTHKKEDLPPLATEINIQEEANIAVTRNKGVKKNVVVEIPKDNNIEKILKENEELARKAALAEEESSKKKKPSKGKIIAIIAITIITLVLLVALSIPILSALGTTRNNAFSGLSLAIPVDNSPIFGVFAKNPKLMIADIFNKPLSGDKDVKSESDKLTATVKVSSTGPKGVNSTSLNINASNKANVDGTSNLNFGIGGTVSSNGTSFTVDPTSLGIEEVTMSDEEYYLKYSLNQDIRNLMFPSSESYINYTLNQIFKKYNGKYIKFSTSSGALSPDDPNFFKPKTTSPTSLFDGFVIDQASFSEGIAPKFKTFVSQELLKANNVVDVVNEGRVKIEGVDSIKLRLKYDKTTFKAFQTQFISDTTNFIMENITPFANLYCSTTLRLLSTSSVKSNEIDSCTKAEVDFITRDKIMAQLNEFNYFDINSAVIYVNAVNNDLTKLTLDLSIDMTKYIENQKVNGTLSSKVDTNTTYDPTQISIDYETVKSSKNLSITAPTDSTSYENFMSDLGKIAKSIIVLQSY